MLQKEIGRGGSSIVFRARHALLDRPVAVKVIAGPYGPLAADTSFLARFRQESELVSRLSHPHILSILDSGQTGPEDEIPDAAFLATEYMPGGNLAGHLETHAASLDQKERCLLAVRVAEQIGAALDHAHSHDILHRDLKPSNILIGTEPLRFVLGDFGLARLLHTGASLHLTATGLVAGTPAYMAPEQALGEPAEPATDLYGLAVVLYEIVVGRVPFDAETPLATMLAHVHQPPPLPRRLSPGVPRAVEVVLVHALAKARDERYGTGYELARALRSAVTAAYGADALEPPPHTIQPVVELSAQRRSGARKERVPVAARRPRRLFGTGRTRRFLRRAAIAGGASMLLFSMVLGSAALVIGPGRFRLAGFAERFVSSTLGPEWTEAAPRDGATNEPLRTRVVVHFSHEMDQQSVQDAFSIEPDVPVSFEWNGRLLTVQPQEPLRPLTSYVVALDNARALDLEGRPLAAPLRRRFTTAASADVGAAVAPAPAAGIGFGGLPLNLFPPQPTAQPTPAPQPTADSRPPAPTATVRIDPILPAPTYAPPTVAPQPPDTSIVAGLVVTAEQVDEAMAAEIPMTPVAPTPLPSTTPSTSSAQFTAAALATGAAASVTPTSVSRPQTTPSPAGTANPIPTGTMSVFPTATPTPARAAAATSTLASGTQVPPAATSTVQLGYPITPTATLPSGTPAPPAPTAPAGAGTPTAVRSPIPS